MLTGNRFRASRMVTVFGRYLIDRTILMQHYTFTIQQGTILERYSNLQIKCREGSATGESFRTQCRVEFSLPQAGHKSTLAFGMSWQYMDAQSIWARVSWHDQQLRTTLKSPYSALLPIPERRRAGQEMPSQREERGRGRSHSCMKARNRSTRWK